ncbi:hypothetical protein DM01DRAFT_1349637 [Hesseltinella vesiculosa]|uniref:F-box domain-containing protein n=1 Tax=Hesseltinella vesiculosa TaxID=101127 RepID=A0A1X2G4P0_9FUNG|nr:hypothetical protein DM01DRAFT_1349637 [Hesseltinella vesiculosa]
MTIPCASDAVHHSPISALPFVLLETIALISDTWDRKQLRLVNRLWQEVTTPLLFEVITLSKYNYRYPRIYVEHRVVPLASSLTFLQHMEQQSNPATAITCHAKSIRVERYDMDVKEVIRLLQICPRVESVTMESMVFMRELPPKGGLSFHPFVYDRLLAKIEPLFRGPASIRKLKLKGYIADLMGPIMLDVLPRLSDLHTLELDCLHWSNSSNDIWPPIVAAIHQHCPSLVALTCYYSRDDYFDEMDRWHTQQRNGDSPKVAIAPWTSIKDLSILLTDGTRDAFKIGQFVTYVAVKFPSLTSLTLTVACDATGSRPWVDLPQGSFQKLTSLKLVCNQGFADCLTVFDRLAPSALKHLTSLELEVDEEEVDVAHILSLFPSLQHLGLDSDGRMTCDTSDAKPPSHTLTSLAIGKHLYHGSHESSTLETIVRMCPSIQHFFLTLDCWALTNHVGGIVDGVLVDKLQQRIDKVLPALSNGQLKPMVVALPHANSLASLGIACRYNFIDSPGLIILASLPSKKTDSAGIQSTVLKSWYIERPDVDRPPIARPWGIHSPPALDALANWDMDLEGLTPAHNVDRLDFIGVIFLPSLPNRVYFEMEGVPMQ